MGKNKKLPNNQKKLSFTYRLPIGCLKNQRFYRGFLILCNEVNAKLNNFIEKKKFYFLYNMLSKNALLSFTKHLFDIKKQRFLGKFWHFLL